MKKISEPLPIADRSDSSSPELWKGLQSPLTLGLVSCGGIGALLFTVVYLIEGVTRPGYDAWLQPISSLSLGPGGWVQQVSFVVFGTLTLLSAVGWYQLLLARREVLLFPLLQGISGLCLIGAGLFSLDPSGYPPGATPGPLDGAWDAAHDLRVGDHYLSGCRLFHLGWLLYACNSLARVGCLHVSDRPTDSDLLGGVR